MAYKGAMVDTFSSMQDIAKLRLNARSEPREAAQAVAQQFEAMFLKTMLKGMREATPTSGLLRNDQTDFYRDLHDQRLASHLSESKGLGIADMVMRQLGLGSEGAPRAPVASEALPVSAVEALPRIRRPAFESVQIARTLVADSPQPGTAVHTPVVTLPDETLVDRWESPEAFVKHMFPHAQDAARKLGGSPEVLIAIAALETGWGKHIMQHPDGRSSYNLFGIKTHRAWGGEQVVAATHEFEHGAMVKIKDAFRAYSTPADSFNDYVDFLHDNPRYREALQQADDPRAFTRALQEAGYATDPEYADKIMRILSGNTLKTTIATLKIDAEPPIA